MQSGTVIAGRYEIERLAGLGGMGTVYRARDRASGQLVALKLARFVADRAGARRFEREARVLAAIDHPNVVRAIDSGATGDGQLYMVTEWLEGTTLASRLGRGALAEDEAIRVGVALADGLAAVHARGIVHRDVKPGNVMLVGDAPGAVVLIDFGLARTDGLDAATAVTSPGSMVGTPGFVSPEQARGDDAIDARADLYSFGSTLFACLTGRAPFAGVHVVALLTKLLFEVAPRASALRAEVSGELDALIVQLLAKQPDARPQSAAEVGTSLRGIAERVPRDAASARAEIVSPAEQRFVTVLLADQPGRGGADPAMVEAIERAGADVEQLARGTVAAVFSERSPGESAVRAARCALAVRATHSDIALAIATGRITVAAHGPMGEVIDRAAGLLMGDDVTLDAAVEHPPGAELAGEVLVDDATARLLETRFQLVLVPDSDHPIGHALRGELVQPRPARRLLGKLIPCVGRARELAALAALTRESAEESAARAVLVTGEAGIGKSRVVHEFLARLSVEGSPPRVWLAGGDVMRANSPLGVLGQLIRDAVGIDEAAPLADRQARLQARAEALFDGDDAARVAAFLGEIAAVRFPDGFVPQLAELRRAREGLRDQMLLAWLDYAVAELAAGPIVVAIEDLHLADRPSVEFVDLALRDARALPLVVVATARPEIREVHPELWPKRACERIALRPLSARACRAIIEHAAAGDDGEDSAWEQGTRDVERIVERSGGNPFVLEEMIRANAWHADSTPDTVLALVGARLGELSPASRRVLRAASVFGRTFWAAGVARLLEADTDHIESLLPDLIAREIVEPRPRARPSRRCRGCTRRRRRRSRPTTCWPWTASSSGRSRVARGTRSWASCGCSRRRPRTGRVAPRPPRNTQRRRWCCCRPGAPSGRSPRIIARSRRKEPAM